MLDDKNPFAPWTPGYPASVMPSIEIKGVGAGTAISMIEKPKPLSSAVSWTRALQRTAGIAGDQGTLLADVVDAHAARDGAAPALLGDGASLTYAALAARSNRYARWALEQDFGVGDCVALMLGNQPDYLAIWLGLSRVGVVTALLNVQATGPALAHCLDAAAPKAVILGAPFLSLYRDAVPASGPSVWLHSGDDDDTPRIDTRLDDYAGTALTPAERRAVTLEDRALLIYTSGTTGLPKAANVSHFRILMWSQWFAGLMDAKPDDRLYDCLPMYHSVGGVVATGAMLAAGGSVVIRERFSASRFWDEVVAWDCTIFQYIGELCRYLVHQPEQPAERAHRLRLCVGNGLRGDVWETFQARFAIPQILEFYAATEGSFSLFNMEGEPGAIGKIPGFMAHRSPVALVRFDTATQMPQRDAAGFCIRCQPGESGEAIGRLAARDTGLSTRFEGYTSRAESDKKVLRDVFAEGDAWFRTGDLMRKDAKGFYYFVDRVGDTFRWKGENVAASEVEAALCACPGVVEATVYGVTIPKADGRAGMAALVVAPGFDFADLRQTLAGRLPAYALPVFVRLRDTLDMTGTFKPKKQDLIREGYDPAIVSEPLYVDDHARDGYVSIDAALYERIVAGIFRV